jgi:hypothetical protein
MYIMKIEPLDGQFYCACNFRDPSLAGSSNLKIADSFDEVHSALPKWVGTYKLKRILFDDPELFELFKRPGLTRMMELVPYVKDLQSAFPDVARFQPSVAAPRGATPTPAKPTAVVIWFILVLIVGYFLLRSCTG